MPAILEVMIGMVFVYSLLSILVTQINTIITNILNLRARHLRHGLNQLLSDPVVRARIMGHPLIGLIQTPILPNQKLDKAQAETLTKSKLNRVTQIAPQTFVNVLINTIKAPDDQDLFAALLQVVDSMPSGGERRHLRALIKRLRETGSGLEDLRAAIAQLDNEIYIETLNAALDQIEEEISDSGIAPAGLVSIAAGIRSLNDPYLRTALEAALASSKTLEEAKARLESWFNDGMARATESFTRNMQFISLAVGLMIALFVNVDSIQIVRTLWNDPFVRQSVAEIAANTDLTALLPAAPVSEGATAESEASLNEEQLQNIQVAAEQIRQTLTEINDLRLPLGWYYDAAGTAPELRDHRNLWNYFYLPNPYLGELWIAKILGLVATMVAIAQGAPFWFNILNRLMRGDSGKSDK